MNRHSGARHQVSGSSLSGAAAKAAMARAMAATATSPPAARRRRVRVAGFGATVRGADGLRAGARCGIGSSPDKPTRLLRRSCATQLARHSGLRSGSGSSMVAMWSA